MTQQKTRSLGLPSVAADRQRADSVTGVERWIAGKVLENLGSPPVRVVLWNGEEIRPHSEHHITSHFTLRINDRRYLRRMVLNPSIAFGDGYSTGGIEVDGDLVEFLTTVFRASPNAVPMGSWRQRMAFWLNRARASNTLAGSRHNIHHHYDLGNEFYQLWLDERMVYTCAYFPSPDISLEEAQLAKMDHVCRKLRLEPDEWVVEAGCGWGSLGLHMAKYYGCKVRSFNISAEQVAYARDRVRSEGLEDRVEYIQDDYRNVAGRYDAFVSVGMLEHVGRNHYRDLGGVIDRCLEPHGRGLIHSIGRNWPKPMDAWIERRIFPGAYPPTVREMMDVFEPYNFSVQDVENLRRHYALTLEHWLERFEASRDRVAEMFDEDFVRAWRLYLSGSIAAFRTSGLQLFQVTFTRADNDELPWTRDYLYAD